MIVDMKQKFLERFAATYLSVLKKDGPTEAARRLASLPATDVTTVKLLAAKLRLSA